MQPPKMTSKVVKGPSIKSYDRFLFFFTTRVFTEVNSKLFGSVHISGNFMLVLSYPDLEDHTVYFKGHVNLLRKCSGYILGKQC